MTVLTSCYCRAAACVKCTGHRFAPSQSVAEEVSKGRALIPGLRSLFMFS